MIQYWILINLRCSRITQWKAMKTSNILKTVSFRIVSSWYMMDKKIYKAFQKSYKRVYKVNKMSICSLFRSLITKHLLEELVRYLKRTTKAAGNNSKR